MDAGRFDALTHALTTARSRRGALATLLGGTLGLLGLADLAAKKGKKKKRRRTKKPTCTDGIQNQGESDVDCSGPCARCANGKRCVSSGTQDNRNHCESASCSLFGYCFACTEHSHCPDDHSGGCACSNGTCIKNTYVLASSCDTCPANTGDCDSSTPAHCYKLCGAL